MWMGGKRKKKICLVKNKDRKRCRMGKDRKKDRNKETEMEIPNLKEF